MSFSNLAENNKVFSSPVWLFKTFVLYLYHQTEGYSSTLKTKNMEITKKVIAEKTTVEQKGFGGRSIREYYVELNTPSGLKAFESETREGIIIRNDNFYLIDCCIQSKKEFVNEVYNFLNS